MKIINDALSRIIAIPQYNIAYMPIPRVASSSMKHTFRSLLQVNCCEDYSQEFIHNKSKNGLSYLGNYSTDKIIEFLYHKRTRLLMLSLCRNPVDRFLSAYKSKVSVISGQDFLEFDERDMLLEQRKIAEYVARLRNINIYDVSNILPEEFLDFLTHSNMRRVNIHWRPQVYIMATEFIQYDRILKLEDIASKEVSLSNEINIDFSIHLNKCINTVKISSETIGKIEELYSSDMRYFNY